MNIFQAPCCSILGVLLVFFLRGSCAGPEEEVHRAVGGSLDLIAGYPKKDLEVTWKYNGTEFAEYENDQFKPLESPLFHKRLGMNKDNISITVENLKLQDSGLYSIVGNNGSTQYKTEVFVLHVHELIRYVQIESSVSWLEAKNICAFHLRCQASGNPSYSWIGDPFKFKTGPNLNISLYPGETATLNCTANNTVSIKNTTKTVVCEKNSEASSLLPVFGQNDLLIAVGFSIVAVIIIIGTVAACCKWKRRTGQGESETGITVYEDVNTEAIAKKRSDSVVNGMSIYETVDDMKVTKNLPQTLYDKINYQRHPAVSACTSSPYQEVL